MNLLVQDGTATQLKGGETPFQPGRNAVATNFTAGALILQGSDDDGVDDPYTTLVTVPATGKIAIDSLPNYIKVSTAATVYIEAGA